MREEIEDMARELHQLWHDGADRKAVAERYLAMLVERDGDAPMKSRIGRRFFTKMADRVSRGACSSEVCKDLGCTEAA